MSLTTDQPFNIVHQEYIGDLLTSASNANSLSAFQLQSFYMNPGNAILFPWLSTIASNFTNFRIKRCVFKYISTSATALNSTNTSLGIVAARIQYDATVTADTTLSQLLNSMGCHKSNPSQSFQYVIDVSKTASALGTVTTSTTPSSLPSNTDSRLYYPNGFIEIVTQGMQANSTNIGELYISYDIDLFRPTYIQGEIGNTLRSAHYGGPSDFTSASPLYVSTKPTAQGTDGIGLTINPTSIVFPVAITTGKYYITVFWVGTGAVAYNTPVITATNATIQQYFINSTVTPEIAPQLTLVGTTRGMLCFIVTINAPGASQATLAFGAAGTLPTSPADIDIYVTQVNGLTN